MLAGGTADTRRTGCNPKPAVVEDKEMRTCGSNKHPSSEAVVRAHDGAVFVRFERDFVESEDPRTTGERSGEESARGTVSAAGGQSSPLRSTRAMPPKLAAGTPRPPLVEEPPLTGAILPMLSAAIYTRTHRPDQKNVESGGTEQPWRFAEKP